MTQQAVERVEPFPFARRLLPDWPDYGCVMLVGESGVGKSVFGTQFVHDGLAAGRKSIAVLTSVSPDRWLEHARSVGFDLAPWAQQDQLVLIDGYSAQAGAPSPARFVLGAAATLSDVSIAITEATAGLGGFHFLFDDLAGVLAYTEPSAAFKFTQIVVSRLREARAWVLCILPPGVVEASLERLVTSMFDGWLQLRLEETPEGVQRFFRIRTMRRVKHPTDWREMTISEKGILLS